MSDTFSDILNFLIPIFVYLFLGWILYQIPVVKKGIDRLREWNANRGNKVNDVEAVTIKSITYE